MQQLSEKIALAPASSCLPATGQHRLGKAAGTNNDHAFKERGPTKDRRQVSCFQRFASATQAEPKVLFFPNGHSYPLYTLEHAYPGKPRQTQADYL
jgi:hypothetical protein